MLRIRTSTIALAVAALVGSGAAMAQVTVQVQGAWARATVQGQMATGAFMTLTADKAGRLVSAASPVAGVTEVHEMKMDGGVMKMAALANGLELPAGKAVELKPGGYHVMLMDLKLPLRKDTTIPLTLYFQDAKGVKSEMQLQVPVSLPTPGVAKDAGHGHGAQGTHAGQGAGMPDSDAIAATMKQQFDRPDALLQVNPVTVDGAYAIAGWLQGQQGGRALLQKTAQGWQINVCAGDGLRDAKALQGLGLNAKQAKSLADKVKAAEAGLDKKTLAAFASFKGTVQVTPGQAHGHGDHKKHH